MTFTNDDIDLAQMPRFEEAEQHSLSPKHRTTNMALAGFLFVLVALIVSVIRFLPFVALPEHLYDLYPVILGAFALLALWDAGYHFFADPLKSYSLRELDVSYSSGLIFRKAVNQPMLRIQHIELTRGPVERMVGLATLEVFSAGGAIHTFKIPGLEVDTAVQIRQFILEHKDLSRHG